MRRLLVLLLWLAAAAVRASQPEVTELMQDYWRAYSKSDFAQAATYLATAEAPRAAEERLQSAVVGAFPNITAVPVREDPRDALVARDGMVLGELPAGARVGTGSPRRRAQLEALGLGLQVVPIRGNVDTRVARVAAR